MLKRGAHVKPLCVGKELWTCGSMANVVTRLTKILDLSFFRFTRKKFLPHFFNITSMGKKLISKIHLTHAPTFFSFKVRSKINKNQGMILGKFQSSSSEIDYWSFDAKALLKSAKVKLRIRISKFSWFIYDTMSLDYLY